MKASFVYLATKDPNSCGEDQEKSLKWNAFNLQSNTEEVIILAFYFIYSIFDLVSIFPGSVMLWGSMATNGVGCLSQVNGIMRKEDYIDILENNLRESARKLHLGRRWTFQQDNDPKHTAKVVKEWFNNNHIDVMTWPPQSPDLNPIENLWSHLDSRVRERPTPPKNATELVAFLKEEWELISSDFTAKLVNSMPRRIAAVINAQGCHIPY
jgi:transposase